jgi:RNA polymerase sigma-70 factor (ECF subfamily)
MAHAPPLRIVRPIAPPDTEVTGAAPEASAGLSELSGHSGHPDLGALFRQHTRYVAAVALRILGRDDEVDDVVQEVFLAAVAGLRDRSSPEAVRGWLATVTVRRACRRLRHRRLRRLLGLERPAPPLLAPGLSADERVLLHRIYEVLDQLPVEQRVAWTLRHLEGEPLDRVAQLCGCSLATAKRRIAAAHTTLERRLGDV